MLTSFYIIKVKKEYRKPLVTTGVLINIGLLAFFKYSALISTSLFNTSSDFGQFLINIPLPIGISFFTFQGISLLVDVYTNNYTSLGKRVVSGSLKQHAINTIFFISYFPQLIAGPIVKAHDFIPQIKTKFINEINWESCFKSLILGYFLKMVVADNLKDFTFWIEYPYFQAYKTIDLIMMLFGYSCQIFADFAGYSLIAIGLAGLFGYNLRDNFNFPYIATSFKDFWKRWHISLSSFLMEYLYFPLGGNRKGRFRTYLNLFIVMALGGLWHGAAWSYLVWGVTHGLFLALERLIFNKLKINSNTFSNYFYSAFVFAVVTFAWLLFKLPNFHHVIEYIKCMDLLHPSFSFSKELFIYILIYSSPIILYHLYNRLNIKFNFNTSGRYSYLFYGIFLTLIVLNSGTSGAFVYFQF